MNLSRYLNGLLFMNVAQAAAHINNQHSPKQTNGVTASKNANISNFDFTGFTLVG